MRMVISGSRITSVCPVLRMLGTMWLVPLAWIRCLLMRLVMRRLRRHVPAVRLQSRVCEPRLVLAHMGIEVVAGLRRMSDRRAARRILSEIPRTRVGLLMSRLQMRGRIVLRIVGLAISPGVCRGLLVMPLIECVRVVTLWIMAQLRIVAVVAIGWQRRLRIEALEVAWSDRLSRLLRIIAKRRSTVTVHWLIRLLIALSRMQPRLTVCIMPTLGR